MNGIDKIIQRLSDDAQQEADAVLAQAQAEADAVRRRYDLQAQKESSDILQRGAAAAAERKSRLQSAADLAARQQLLAVKQEMLDQAFARALERLTALPEENYVALLTELAVKAADTGRGQLVLNQSDRARYGVKVASAANDRLEQAGRTPGLSLSEQSGSFRGGLILQNGDLEVNCTFETLIRLGRSRLARDAARILFD